MVNNDQDEPLQPIIIVKRGGGDHDEHHGGVWKIAFADFMTAMMAFFLVMWLINAANEETRSQVASYFNPVKLTDAVAAPKGVRSSKPFTETEEHDDKNADGGGGARRKGGGGSEAEEAEKDKAKEEAAATSERTLFQDPYAVLVEIAGERSPSAVPTADNGTMGQGGDLTGGEAFRDPFDPAFWLRPDDENQGEGEADPTGADADPAMTALVEKLPVKSEDARPDTPEAAKPTKVLLAEKKTILEKKTVVEEKTMPESDSGEMSADKQKAMAEVDTGEHKPSDQQIADGEQSDAKGADPPKTVKPEPSKTEMAAAELKAEIMAATDTAGLGQKPVLSVDRTDEGLVVSLTDDLDFGMFASASARPNAEMVKFMDRIASVLAKREGRLVVRGHTDSRPFRSEAYDNWRLSTARAHMAYHMLVRGGVDTDRFARIEGYADRDPKNKTDTEAAENRRIEILLVEKQS